ncbi:hypothetical protein N7495_002695 [Penicillium taxi]|uniref:uncharacterized protein n=1 Tax=Penicillium taxi TaxID=168475 RepID=UPI002544EBD2|nr:uncharacterized protein N7495_002695 [Penicillium taxi]KAJ5902167.1 hypothetical protein N7495_002695 [Penicillium taxi]
MTPKPVHQPIHPSVRPFLNQQYVKFHDDYFQYVIPDDQKVWDGSARTGPRPWPSTESPLAKIAGSEDLNMGKYEIRIFTPEGAKPGTGWPVFIWFHGGGWAIGGKSDGNDLCTLICQMARCVVVTVDYRLAPEHPYPAAVEDAVDALKWVYSAEGATKLGTDSSRITIGGTSAGGNLAAVLSMKASQLEPPVPICFQLLVLPVIDNTATTETFWGKNRNAPWLTPARMDWYRRMYLPNPSDALGWEASPNLAPTSLLAKSPKTWIAVSGQDLLAPEAEAYAGQLEKAWKENGGIKSEVTVKVYEGATHSLLSMSGVLDQGADLLRDSAQQIAKVFSGFLDD